MCVDGESFELYVEDNDTDTNASPFEEPAASEIGPVEIEEHSLAAEAVKYRPLRGWNLSNDNWEDEGIRY
jgi:hypothetical protein